MIHKFNSTDGKTTYRAYSLRNIDDDDGHVLRFLGAHETAEAAKDQLQVDLAKQIRKLERKANVLRMALEGDFNGSDGHDVGAACSLVDDLYGDAYFLGENAETLFLDCDHDRAHLDGVISLYGEAGIEHARRHGLKVKYAEFEGGNHAEGFPIDLTPGQAMERMPQTPDRWIWVDVPRDVVDDDLPPDIFPLHIREPSKPLSVEDIRWWVDFERRQLERWETRLAEAEADAGAEVQ